MGNVGLALGSTRGGIATLATHGVRAYIHGAPIWAVAATPGIAVEEHVVRRDTETLAALGRSKYTGAFERNRSMWRCVFNVCVFSRWKYQPRDATATTRSM